MQDAKSFKSSMTAQIIIAVALGAITGLIFTDGQLQIFIQGAKTILQWIRILAGPFLFLSVLAALVSIQTTWFAGVRLIGVALINTAFALFIGMSLTYAFVKSTAIELPANTGSIIAAPSSNLSWESWLKTMGPDSLFAPLVSNEILWIALMSLVFGIAIRRAFADDPQAIEFVLRVTEGAKKVLEQLLHWILRLIPLAVFLVISGSVSQYGLEIFEKLASYVLVVVLGLALQVILIYGAWLTAFAKMSLKIFWHEARRPVFFALGMNSSLATLPLTMKALKNLKVSDQAASLGAGVATNLNNDGIVLYEASAVFFIAHLHGIDWNTWQMLAAAGTCLIAAMGITGVPEAGFISLTVAVTSLGLPVEFLPLLLSVDWVMARLRSVVNVLSDMTLSIVVDRFLKK